MTDEQKREAIRTLILDHMWYDKDACSCGLETGHGDKYDQGHLKYADHVADLLMELT